MPRKGNALNWVTTKSISVPVWFVESDIVLLNSVGSSLLVRLIIPSSSFLELKTSDAAKSRVAEFYICSRS